MQQEDLASLGERALNLHQPGSNSKNSQPCLAKRAGKMSVNPETDGVYNVQGFDPDSQSLSEFHGTCRKIKSKMISCINEYQLNITKDGITGKAEGDGSKIWELIKMEEAGI